MVKQIFNEIIRQNAFPPEAWKKVKIKVLLKKGDVENVGNCRPTCSLPALYKLFSTILYGRLYPRLDQEQAEDQAGFRSSYQTTDHFASCRMIEHKCHECGIKMWIATIDSDVESNMFEIKKGTKQGDPLSSLLFNTVLENSLKEVTQRWQKKKGMGIYLSDHYHDCLTNLRFADDVMLFATSKEQIRRKQQRKWDSGFTQTRRRFSATRAA